MSALASAALRLRTWLAVLSDRREPDSERADLEHDAFAAAFDAALEFRRAENDEVQS
jgi:hypothetical protein